MVSHNDRQPATAPISFYGWKSWLVVNTLLVQLIACQGCDSPRQVANVKSSTGLVELAANARPGEAFAVGYEFYRKGDKRSALIVFEELQRRSPFLSDYTLFFGATLREDLGDEPTAIDQFQTLVNEFPRSIHSDAGLLQLAGLLRKNGRTLDARAALDDLRNSDDKEIAAKARFSIAEIGLEEGDQAWAYDEFERMRREFRGRDLGRKAKDVVLRLRQESPALMKWTATDRFEEAELLLRERDYQGALDIALSLKESPSGLSNTAIRRLYAEALLGTGQLEAGLKELWALARDDPESAETPGVLFRMASVLWNKDRDEAASRVFREILQRYPNASAADDAFYAGGRIQQTAGRSALAIESYHRFLERFPRSRLRNDVRWRIGWTHYRSRQWWEAAKAFADLAGGSSGRDYRSAMYWRARSHQQLGRIHRATELYRELLFFSDSYYGMLAALRLEQLERGHRHLATTLDGSYRQLQPPEYPVTSELVGSDFHLDRYKVLKEARLHKFARAELKALEKETGDDEIHRYILRAYTQVGGFHLARKLQRELGERAALSAAENDELQYPLAFWEIVDREASLERIDPLLVVAIMRQESAFDPEALSPANARGLLQLLPSTAKSMLPVDEELGGDDLYRPETNIPLGVRYLRTLLNRFSGDVFKTIAAYNGGEKAVDKWVRRFPGAEADEFVETISYRETRDYVKRVISNLRAYETIYAAKSRS